jgi:hypothetical protein
MKFLRRFSAFLVFLLFVPPSLVLAQNVDSTNYTLIAPSLDSTTGSTESTNYSALNSGSPIDEYTLTSSTYEQRGGPQAFYEANVPSVSCLETSTNSGSTSCTGVPGGQGMQGVCSIPGCYDRMKLEINPQNNSADTRYAVQISTSSDFSSGVFYVDGTTRTLITSYDNTDFLYKCEWEGTVVSGLCGSPNTTWQKYNILGLNSGKQYYVRLSAYKGSNAAGEFTQTEWGPSANATLQNPTISMNVDVGPSSTSTSNSPYKINFNTIVPDTVTTSNDYMIYRLSTNALNGIEMNVQGVNGELYNAVAGDDIPAVNADLASNYGYGIRNDYSTNSQYLPPSGGLDFDGTDDYTTASDSGFFEPSTNLTISFWAYFDEVDTGTQQNLVIKGHTSSPFYSYQIFEVGGYICGHWVNTSDNVFDACSYVQATTGKWHHIAFVKDGSNLYMYLDGIQYPSFDTPSGSIKDSNSDLRFGAGGAGNNHFDGKMDDIRIFGAGLSQSQIRADMFDEISGTTLNLVGYWKLNEGTGQDILDSTINLSDGVLGATSSAASDDPTWSTGFVSTGLLGVINVSSSPSDFTDSGAPNKVGAPTTSLVKLFDSGGKALHTGVSAYKVKVKASYSDAAGVYTETITAMPVATF